MLYQTDERRRCYALNCVAYGNCSVAKSCARHRLPSCGIHQLYHAFQSGVKSVVVSNLGAEPSPQFQETERDCSGTCPLKNDVVAWVVVEWQMPKKARVDRFQHSRCGIWVAAHLFFAFRDFTTHGSVPSCLPSVSCMCSEAPVASSICMCRLCSEIYSKQASSGN